MATLKTGCLAYLDSFAGLVPCKVESIKRQADGLIHTVQATVRFTATRGAYKRGDVHTSSCLWVFPRDAVYRQRSMSGARVRPYDVRCDKAEGAQQ